MKKMVTLLAVIVALSTLASPALAEPPTPVAGTFDYTFEILDSWTANGNTFLYAVEYEDWEGDFLGTAVAHFTVEMFSSGFWNVHLRSEFTGTVGDRQGSMIIQLVGKKPAGDDWAGQWVIISGTGDLANVRGHGTWGGPGFGADGPDIWYTGQITSGPG